MSLPCRQGNALRKQCAISIATTTWLAAFRLNSEELKIAVVRVVSTGERVATAAFGGSARGKGGAKVLRTVQLEARFRWVDHFIDGPKADVIRLSLGNVWVSYWLTFCKWSNGLIPQSFLNKWRRR